MNEGKEVTCEKSWFGGEKQWSSLNVLPLGEFGNP